MRLLFLLSLLLLGGCGYHVQGRQSNLPPDVRTVSVELFENRTLEPLLENEVTNAVTDRFSRGRALRLVSGAGEKDAVLTGSVAAYDTKPVSYDTSDNILEYRSTMTVTAVLRRSSSGQSLWRGTAIWSEEYPASGDKGAQQDNEAAAIRVIADRLADELYARILSNF